MHAPARTFPPFSLKRLLTTVFAPKGGERVAILIDLENPGDVANFAFLKDPKLTIQKHAYEVFYQGLQGSGLKELGFSKADFYAYKITGGSNLDLPDEAFTPRGSRSAWRRTFIRITTSFSASRPTRPPHPSPPSPRNSTSAARRCTASTRSSSAADWRSITTR